MSRTAPIPVLMVHADTEPVITRLLVPIDGSERAKSAIPVARALAERLDAPIEFVYVMDDPRIPPGGLGASVMTGGLIAEATAVGQQALHDAMGEVHGAGVVTTARLVRGIAGEALIEATKPGDLLVMSSHGRSGVAR